MNLLALVRLINQIQYPRTLEHTAMANDTTPGTIHCASLASGAPSSDGSPQLDYICFPLYLLWLVVVLLVMLTEWRRRTRKSLKWILWLPFMIGIMPSIFTIRSAGLQSKNDEFYSQTQATRDFLKMCSDPLTQELDPSIATQSYFAECNTVQNRMNADIGGIGIRVSLYISLVVTILSSFAGHFHQEKTAVKDIGTAQLACKFPSASDVLHANNVS